MLFEEVIIHIGVHKTASSFLQQSFFSKLSRHTLVTRPYTQLNHAWNKLQYGNDCVYDPVELKNELIKINARRLIISDESFEGNPFGLSNSQRDIIAKRLSDLFPNAKIVVFIRDHYDWLNSLYAQYLKAHRLGVKRLNDIIHVPAPQYQWSDVLLNNPGKRTQSFFNTSEFVIHPPACRFSDLISTYKSLFASVRVFLFEDFQKQSLALFKDVFPDYPNELFSASSSVRINERFGERKLKRYMYAKRLYVLSGKSKPSVISRTLSAIASWLDCAELYEISPEKRRYLDELFIKDCIDLKVKHRVDVEQISDKYLCRWKAKDQT